MLASPLLAFLLVQPVAPPPGAVAPAPAAPASPQTTPAATLPPAARWSDALKGKWTGTIALPNGQSLGFILNITGPDSATIAIPQQSLPETALTQVTIDAGSMAFSLTIPGAAVEQNPSWELKPADDLSSAEGTMRQSGMSLNVTAKKLAEGEKAVASNRPQTPKAPFPYQTRDVAYESFDGAAMNGTLTIPAGSKPESGFPCVLFITGSGTQDRDETIFEHKPFALLADALARAGVASLRVDDRGFGGAKDPAGRTATSETFASDVKAGLRFLRRQPELNPRIGLIGHSEGGLIAPAVAAAAGDQVGFLVLMAPPGVTGREVLQRQLIAIMQVSGATRSEVDVAAARQKATLTALAEGNTQALRQSLREAIQENASAAGAAAPQDQEMEEAVDAALKQLDTPWMRHFIARDPRPDLRKVRCPVLVLNGGRDAQVVPEQNVPEVVKGLLDGGNTSVTARVFPGLNHLFQPCSTGAIGEYATIETTMDPSVIRQIVGWVTETANRK